MSFVLCVVSWLCAAGLLSCFDLLVSLLLGGSVLHCDHLVGEVGPGLCISPDCVLSVIVCLLFLLVSFDA